MKANQFARRRKELEETDASSASDAGSFKRKPSGFYFINP